MVNVNFLIVCIFNVDTYKNLHIKQSNDCKFGDKSLLYVFIDFFLRPEFKKILIIIHGIDSDKSCFV